MFVGDFKLLIELDIISVFDAVMFMLNILYVLENMFSCNADIRYFRLYIVCCLCLQIMGYKIFTHEIHSSYAARIDNFRSYDTISKDIIQRWTYPYVPDINFCGNRASKLERQGMYRASGNVFIIFIYLLWLAQMGVSNLQYLNLSIEGPNKGTCTVVPNRCWYWLRKYSNLFIRKETSLERNKKWKGGE